MQKITEIKPVFIDEIPKDLEEGNIYISRKYHTAVHLCCCGCKGLVITPFMPNFWTMMEKDDKISLTPSIGNWSGEDPYHAHYYITNNQIQHC